LDPAAKVDDAQQQLNETFQNSRTDTGKKLFETTIQSDIEEKLAVSMGRIAQARQSAITLVTTTSAWSTIQANNHTSSIV